MGKLVGKEKPSRLGILWKICTSWDFVEAFSSKNALFFESGMLTWITTFAKTYVKIVVDVQMSVFFSEGFPR